MSEPDKIEAIRDATSVVEALDRRVFVTPSHVVTLAGDLPASPGVIDRLTLTTGRLYVERVVVDVPDLGGGSAGETVFDVLAGGASLYPSSATDDQRPRFAFDAAELAHTGSVPEVRELRRGDEITFATAEHATDGTPSRARLQIFGWAV